MVPFHNSRRKEATMRVSSIVFLTLSIVSCTVISGCGKSETWKKMNVVTPEGREPIQVFRDLRQAEIDRDWPKFYGCMTNELRADTIRKLLLHTCTRAFQYNENPESFHKASKEAEVKAKACFALLERHGLKLKDQCRLSDIPYPDDVTDPDTFVAEAWDVWYSQGKLVIPKEVKVSEVIVSGDSAHAKPDPFGSPHREGWGYLRFKKVEGHWLIDQTPWWIPWGSPPHIDRDFDG